MEYRSLGSADLKVSVIAMGAWAIGGSWAHGWGEVDDEESIKSIRRALDKGINIIDTANVYGLGHSEEVIAKAIEGRRDEVIIATKVGATLDENGDVIWNSTAEHILQEIEGSLRRLQTDYVDIYQIHWPDANTPLEETMGAFNRLVEQGKVRYVGVCNFSLEQLKEAVQYAPIVSHQIRYNMLERDMEAEIFPFCIEHGIGTLIYGPLAHGLLAGEFKRGDKLAEDDWRSRYTLFEPQIYEKIMGVVDQLRPIADSYGRPLAHLTIKWMLGRPGVTCALVGMRQSRHVDENVRAVEGWELRDEDVAQIDRIIGEADLGLRILAADEYLDEVK
jgi:aryl-alcohol dehydrogenase-like predicted oxidoreductase